MSCRHRLCRLYAHRTASQRLAMAKVVEFVRCCPMTQDAKCVFCIYILSPLHHAHNCLTILPRRGLTDRLLDRCGRRHRCTLVMSCIVCCTIVYASVSSVISFLFWLLCAAQATSRTPCAQYNIDLFRRPKAQICVYL